MLHCIISSTISQAPWLGSSRGVGADISRTIAVLSRWALHGALFRPHSDKRSGARSETVEERVGIQETSIAHVDSTASLVFTWGPDMRIEYRAAPLARPSAGQQLLANKRSSSAACIVDSTPPRSRRTFYSQRRAALCNFELLFNESVLGCWMALVSFSLRRNQPPAVAHPPGYKSRQSGFKPPQNHAN